ncbi:fibroblast growth factor receptor-like 1 isoform X1 [Amphiura filiformis]|uniref:fibroblast growth factor receptor-like 1 isoform X1 n=1 Tax=Amphiura filiformis TaxID=82378 RepID=UPI003B213FCE
MGYFAASCVLAAEVRGPPRQLEAVEGYKKSRTGRTVKLLCPVSGNPVPLTMWTKDGESINDGWERFRVRSTGLKIKDVVVEDSGQYVCRATNGFGSVSINFTLTVDDENWETSGGPKEGSETTEVKGNGVLPQFSQPSKMKRRNIARPIGSSVRLKCGASGQPKPQIIWEKDGRTLTDADLGTSKKAHWTLHLNDLKPTDSGQFTCIVFNKHGQINATYTLDVVEQAQRKPELQGEHPINTTVEYGGTTSFQCRVRSDTQPHIQWLKRVEPHNVNQIALNATIDMQGQKFLVLPPGEIMKRNDGSFLNKLMIKSATESDEGMYICLGANNMGFSFKSAFLEVLPATQNQLSESSNVDDGPIRRNNRTNNEIRLSKHLGLNPTKKALLIGLPLGFGFVFCLAAIVFTYNCNRQQGNVIVHHPPPNQLSNHLAKKDDIHHSRNGLPNGINGLPNGVANSHHGSSLHHPSDCEQSMPLTGQVPGQNSLQTFPINSSRETALNRYVEYPPSSYTDTLNSDRSRGSSRLHSSHHSSHLHHPHRILHHHGSNSLMHHGSNSLVHHC